MCLVYGFTLGGLLTVTSLCLLYVTYACTPLMYMCTHMCSCGHKIPHTPVWTQSVQTCIHSHNTHAHSNTSSSVLPQQSLFLPPPPPPLLALDAQTEEETYVLVTHWHLLLCSALFLPLYIDSCWCDHIHYWRLMYAAVYLCGGGCACTSPSVVC